MEFGMNEWPLWKINCASIFGYISNLDREASAFILISFYSFIRDSSGNFRRREYITNIKEKDEP